MKIEKNVIKGVLENGKVIDGGAVVVNGRISKSAPNGGCGAPGCECSPGHWISVVLPRTPAGEVESVLISFDTKEEMENFLKN